VSDTPAAVEEGADTLEFVYQLSGKLLVMGLVCLVAGLVMLLMMAGDDPGAIWWTVTSLVAGILILTMVVSVASWRHGTITVRVHEHGVALPVGALGTTTLDLAWSDIRALRLIGRETMFKRDRSREVIYFVHEDGYTLVISEIFENMGEYKRCRDAILDRVKAGNPDVRIDIDGRIVHPESLAAEDRAAEGTGYSVSKGSDSSTL